MNKKPLTIYFGIDNAPEVHGADWSLLYPTPKILYSSMIKNKNSSTSSDSFLACPAVSDLSKNILEFYSPMDLSYKYDFRDQENMHFSPNFPSSINTEIRKTKTLKYSNTVTFQLRYFLFAEESLTVNFTPPYFSKPEYTQYGSVIPGRVDIGQWFRQFNFEVQPWSDHGEFHIKENEPLFYAQLQTDRPIVIKNFSLTPKLHHYAEACKMSTDIFGRGQTMASRYARFSGTSLRNKVLTEIKKNLID